MQTHPDIVFDGLDPAPHVREHVTHRVERLGRIAERIVACRVSVDQPRERPRHGHKPPVRVEVTIPGKTFAVTRKPGDAGAHSDLLVAVRDAFDIMEQRLRQWKERHSGAPVRQVEQPAGRVIELHRPEGWGRIALGDGQIVYFHRHSMMDGEFEALRIADAVEVILDEEDSGHGPRASAVRRLSNEEAIARLGKGFQTAR